MFFTIVEVRPSMGQLSQKTKLPTRPHTMLGLKISDTNCGAEAPGFYEACVELSQGGSYVLFLLYLGAKSRIGPD